MPSLRIKNGKVIMALYDYQCTKCNHQMIDIHQSIKDKPLRKCPICKKLGLERIISGGLMGTVKEVTTIGAAIDKNHKVNKNRLREQQCQKEEAQNKGKKIPWYQSGRTLSNREVKKLGWRQLKKYIQQGQT
jgi:putative FmdB family regulatory protein